MSGHVRAKARAFSAHLFYEPPVSDALGNSKEVMSQDLGVSLHCHCNFTMAVSEGVSFLRRGKSREDRTRL
jgi:hypothetical protein